MNIEIDGQIILDLKQKFKDIHISLVGSFPIPSVEPKDLDILVYREEGVSPLLKYLTDCGYVIEGAGSDEYPEDIGFKSLRKGVANVIVTQDIVFYNNFRRASQICKELDLKERSKRVLVHKIIFQGVIDQECSDGYVDLLKSTYRDKLVNNKK